MKVLKETIQPGWHENRRNCPVQVLDYWDHRAKLVVVDDMMFKGSKLVIPFVHRQMLQKIHKGDM